MYPKFSPIFTSQANRTILCTAVRGIIDKQLVQDLTDEEIQHAVDLQIRDTEYEKTYVLIGDDTLADYNLMAASKAVRDIYDAKSKLSAENARELSEKDHEKEIRETKRGELMMKERFLTQEIYKEEEKLKKTPRTFLHGNT